MLISLSIFALVKQKRIGVPDEFNSASRPRDISLPEASGSHAFKKKPWEMCVAMKRKSTSWRAMR
jgi:hypothetical protein